MTGRGALALGLVALTLTACEGEPAAPEPAASADPVEAHYYSRPADGEGAHPWVVVLPGGGGIEVFGDTEFYFDVAREWNARGFDALVIHYQEAAPLLGIAPDSPPGPMEASVVADALARAGANGSIDPQCPGFAIGFSMGGAGVTTLAANPPANFVGGIGMYPMIAGQPEGYRAQVPYLVLQGESDDFTTLAALDAFLAAAAPENIAVVRYPGAEHGFDIPSTAEGIEYQGGLFQYREADAEAARGEIERFVAARLAETGNAGCTNSSQG